MKRTLLAVIVLAGIASVGIQEANAQAQVATVISQAERDWLKNQYGWTDEEVDEIVYFNRNGTYSTFYTRMKPGTIINRSGSPIFGTAVGENATAGNNSISYGTASTTKTEAVAIGYFSYAGDVPPRLSSTTVWSPILNDKEIGREQALYRRTDHWLPA